MSDSSAPQANQTFLFRRPQLSITWPDGRQETFTIQRDVVRVGRGAENDLVTPDFCKSISRKHFEIHRVGQAYQIIDLESNNGVFVNGLRIEGRSPLQDGDEIQVGAANLEQQARMVFHLGDAISTFDFEETPATQPDWQAAFTQREPEGRAYLKIHWPDGSTHYFALDGESTLVGRSPDCALQIPARYRFVSGYHAEIRQTDEGVTIQDTNSANGTRVNNQPLGPNQPVPLGDGSIIRIGDEQFGISIGLSFHNPNAAHPKVQGFAPTYAKPTLVTEQKEILIGRDETCDMVLPTPTVSRNHDCVA